jgi:hypothetical protein
MLENQKLRIELLEEPILQWSFKSAEWQQKIPEL